MITDPVPGRGSKRKEYERSDAMRSLAVPVDDQFHASAIDSALSSGSTAAVRASCEAFLAETAGFYAVSSPELRVLAARPMKIREAGIIAVLIRL